MKIMHSKKLIALVLLIWIPTIAPSSIPISSEKDLTGKLIYIGPTPRLMYEFTPKQWSSFGLTLQLEQIRLDSICYTKDWLRGTRYMYKVKFWKEKIKYGTDESKAWGIEPGTNKEGILDFITK